jgi:tRNA pseudouridine38-40 synthase
MDGWEEVYMPNIKLVIEYDGTGYGGWQKQKNAVTVQETLEDALQRITGEKNTVIGAGRTDSGVHALGQVANFHTQSSIPPERFAYALNAVLPPDIRIKASEQVPEDFHARYSATGKKYRYSIHNHVHGTAIDRNTSYHVREKLSVKEMEEAASFLIGTHDFKSFCAAGSSVKTTVRTVQQAFFQQEGSRIDFYIEGNGFLYNMVRIIAGTLIEVGKGKRKPGEMSGIIEARDRRMAGPTAPAKALCLLEVMYENS